MGESRTTCRWRPEHPGHVTRLPGRLHTVLAAELVDPSGRINDFLGAGIKRVTGRTDVDMQFVSQRRLGLKLIAAAADNFDFLV